MKFTLYKDNKFAMQRKHFYPLRVFLLKALGMKSVFEISTKEVIKKAKKNNYRMEMSGNEIWSIKNSKW